jgi:hypothetical protein
MPLPKWHYRAGQNGPTLDSEVEPENPWLRKPQGVAEQLQHAEALHALRRQLEEEMVASGRFLDLKPPAREERRLAELYAVDPDAPGADVIMRGIGLQQQPGSSNTSSSLSVGGNTISTIFSPTRSACVTWIRSRNGARAI